ncbi:MAG: hypothetical protein LBN00_03410 [Oscillospiraceae bacterium]|jgi:hypothetical protein|nr:hypothetical protein [Oscillospiraceae bacterium]
MKLEFNGEYLNIRRPEYPEIERPRLIRVVGDVRFEQPAPEIIRFYGDSARFEIAGLKQFDNGFLRADGCVEVAYTVLGKLLFVPVRGQMRQNSHWNCEKAQCDDFAIDFDGGFECEVRLFESNIQK